jgi:hypothetical protein
MAVKLRKSVIKKCMARVGLNINCKTVILTTIPSANLL